MNLEANTAGGSMDRRDEITKDERDDIDVASPDERSNTGDVLGISQVPVGGTGEIHAPRDRGEERSVDEGRITPLEDEVDLGARDVTKDGRGQTGPETGGHGSTPRRTGATGMDIG
jgi:hypothetical protein